VGVTRVVVHIDRLVLRGFPDSARAELAASLRSELARELTTPGAAERVARVGHVARLRVTSEMTDRERASGAGTSSARAIGAGAGRGIGQALGS
jgi:hypothetical protein